MSLSLTDGRPSKACMNLVGEISLLTEGKPKVLVCGAATVFIQFCMDTSSNAERKEIMHVLKKQLGVYL